MSREEFETFHAHKKEKQKEGEARRRQAAEEFSECFQYARVHGIGLKQCSEIHYQVIVFRADDTPKWVYSLYPGNQRICAEEQYTGPFLCVPKPWTLREFLGVLVSYCQREQNARASLRRKYQDDRNANRKQR